MNNLDGLVIEDLATVCTECDGRGNFSETTGSGSGFGMRSMTKTMNGCPHCQKGLVLTESGKVLKEFANLLSRHDLLR